jgi:hypothetical protein
MVATSNETAAKIVPVHADTFTTCMEQLQVGYVTAVAATAGYLVQTIDRDYFGVDVQFVRPADGLDQEKLLWAQLKCTTSFKPDPTKAEFGFQFSRRKNLEQLAKTRSRPKAILLVMTTDPVQAGWTSGDHDQLAIVNCCYWVHLEGHQIADGVEKPSVRVPTKQIFDAAALISLMDTLGVGATP